MNLLELREKTLAFLVPIIIIVFVLGGSIALIGKAYFWDVSEISMQFVEGSKQVVRVEIQARIIYFDADFFGFYYPVHITLPRTYEQECVGMCTFSRLPPGDAVVTVFSDTLPLRTRVLILADTVGSLDFRPPFQIVSVNTPEIEANFLTLSDADRQLLVGTTPYSSRTQGIVLIVHKSEYALYDISSRQSVLLPPHLIPIQIARGEEPDTYIIWTDEATILWDRYGRDAPKNLTEFDYQNYTFTWKGQQTTITSLSGKQMLPGYWSPLFSGEKMYITDGKEVREVK